MANRTLSLSRSQVASVSSLAVALTLSLTGCGAGSTAKAPASLAIPAIQGRIMGGETPIAGSKVILWVTDPANSGYGIATNGSTTGAQQLATATGSSPGGNFGFTTGYTCAPGEFVYLTSTGGDVSNGSAMTNNNVVLVAALGSCSNFATAGQQAKVNILINEVSTVAAAYALNAFTTMDTSTPGSQKVYMGAPTNNNATTGACTGTGAAMTCMAAGLSHAFANALELTDSVRFDTSFPTGTANQIVPGNTNSSVPQALINTLADILQYCTNSAGTTSGAGDGTACGNLFSYATSPGGIVPTDTFSAMMNIARAPWNNAGSGTCSGTTGGLFCLVPSPAAFNPVLSASPHDWSVAIAYAGPSSAVSFGSPQWLSLDANDNLYVQTSDSYTPSQNGLAAMTSTGSFLWNNAPSTTLCVNGSTQPDAAGNVIMTVNAASSAACTWGAYEYSATTGALEASFLPASGTVCGSTSPTSTNCPGFTAYDTVHGMQSTPKAIAFDRQNNFWLGRNSSSCTNCVFEYPYTAGTGGNPGTFAAYTTFENSVFSSNELLVDANQNVWVGNASTSSSTAGALYLIPNTGTAAAPTYTSTSGFVKQALATYDNGGIGIDSAGNVWSASQGNIYEYHPTLSGASSTFNTVVLNPQPGSTTPNHPYTAEMDGGGMFWYPSLTNSGQLWYQATALSTANFSSTASNNYGYIRPCYVPLGSSTCDTALGSSKYISGDIHALQVDSAGAVWAAAGVDSTFTQGYVVQVLGVGTPTWPLYQYGIFGTKPQ